MRLLDPTACELGEGAFWHPERQEFLWLDILGRRLHSTAAPSRDLPELTSAMAWVDRDRLLLSTETGLWLYDLGSGKMGEQLVAIADDAPDLRSNDGRADPWGGFWASTMGKAAQGGAGAIRRWFGGELRVIRDGLTIPNAICFDRRRGCAYFADTAAGTIWRQPLDPATGWPAGGAEVFLDLAPEGLSPDGAVTDAAGNLWNAQWGAGRVACYDPGGRLVASVPVPARQASCPAFGGAGLSDLMVTTAWEGLDPEARRADPQAGCTFATTLAARGLPEPRVLLP